MIGRYMDNKLLLIKTTLPKTWREFEVTSFAQNLIEVGAACIHHHKVSSTYKWEGKIKSEDEWSLQIKVSHSIKQAVVNLIEETHPYDVPQILIFELISNKEYIDWVESC